MSALGDGQGETMWRCRGRVLFGEMPRVVLGAVQQNDAMYDRCNAERGHCSWLRPQRKRSVNYTA